ncbi:MAG TPA: cytochrome P450 [Acidimicrobiales bacterium]|jgi:cytochrome P450|nr:cytochrome P450 [Acidimicrobiales bacterium]
MSRTTLSSATKGAEFAYPEYWGDMDSWHRKVAEYRRTDPILKVELDGFEPFWALTRHADVFAVSRDNQRWINTSRSVLAAEADTQRMMESGVPEPRTLIHLDGQDHKDHRMVTSDWFKPATVKHRQSRIEGLADLFVEKMRAMGGTCDFARDIAQPYTLRVIMDIYGVPESDEPLMMELTQGLFGAADPEFLGDADDPGARLIESVMKFMEYFNAITEDRQKTPTSDLASVIANGQPGGCPMGDIERIWYYIIVATAGHDTTSYALSGGMEAMLRDPSQLWALRDDPELAGNAADECIRWTAPVRHFMRYATEDNTVGDVDIPAGGRVLLSYPSANRDEEVFTDSMTFDVRRSNAEKLVSFGAGAHFCLGSQFARREVRTMLGKLAAQLDHIEPTGPAQWSESSFVSGVKHLPISYSFR